MPDICSFSIIQENYLWAAAMSGATVGFDAIFFSLQVFLTIW
jgi:hypothetical protein